MIFNAFELADNIIIIGNHDRIEILPDLPDIGPDDLQIFSPDEFCECVISHGEYRCQWQMYSHKVTASMNERKESGSLMPGALKKTT
jgi:hypothetical protein